MSLRIAAALAAAALAGPAVLPAQPASPPAGGILVAFGIDTSGSLSPADLTRAGALAAGILSELPAGSESVLFTFDDQPRVVVPRTSSPDAIRSALAGLRRRGRHTAMNDALYDAARLLRDSGARRRALVLITDGRDEESAVELADGLAVAQQSGIPVFTVGVGRVDERVLRRIAKLTGGEYVPLRAARGAAIAGGIAGFAGIPPGTAIARGPDSAPPPSAAPASLSAAATRPTSGRSRPFAWAIAGLVVLLAVAVLFLARRREPGVGEAPAAELLAPTILEKMSSTEEYLEKTVTLRERPVLTVTRGPAIGQVFDLRNQAATSIGRSKANEIVIDDVSVSSEHCRIRPEDGHFVLHDLKSTNGTFVNERRVTRHVLEEGDVLKIGETSLLFKTDLKRT